METLGKKKCEVLRNIRMKIAEENGITYVPAECHHEGDCPGTCPRCDAELRYLQNEIDKKHGKSAKPSIAASAIGGILTTAMLATLNSCNPFRHQTVGDVPILVEGEMPAPTTIVDSTMVGTQREVYFYSEKDSANKVDSITITKEMIGDCIEFPDSGSAVWKAIEELKKKQ